MSILNFNLTLTLNAILLFNSSYKELCIEQIRPVLKKANTIRDYDYHVGNCTFPAQSSNLQNYGSCYPMSNNTNIQTSYGSRSRQVYGSYYKNITSCGANIVSGVTYEKNRCNAPIFWYNDDIEKSITYWDIGNIDSFTCNPYYLG